MTEFAESAKAKVGWRLSFLLTPLLAGCATIVIPPANPVDPVTVYLADYGKHSSLFLPNSDGTFEEYATGDWDYFCLGKTNWWVALRALVHSPQPTLGRRKVESVDPSSLGTTHMAPLRAARARADALWHELDDRFHHDSPDPHFSSHSQLDHVPDPEPYWALNNCNHKTAEWLRQLGCQIQGPAVWSNFVVGENR